MSDWRIIRLWRSWIRPAVFSLYAILLVIALPLCIGQLHKHNAPANVEAWFYGGLFVMMCLPISFLGIIMHCIHYTKPDLQKPIVRILWMVPIYALNSWFALLFEGAAIYLDTLRECYEAYVVYSFMTYLLNFLHDTYHNFNERMADKPWNRLICPCCCCPPWPSGTIFINRCKHGVLQYTVVRPITTVIALICEINGVFNEGMFDFGAAWPYLTFINNLSQFWAMYCLILFYTVVRDELQPLKPVPKFFCVKAVVFFSFWQSVLISILANAGVFNHIQTWPLRGFNGTKAIVHGLQNFCICVEMFFAAIAHYYSFSHKPYINVSAPPRSFLEAVRSMWDVSDVGRDVAEHVKVVGAGISKRVPGQRRDRGLTTSVNEGLNGEKTPLLSADANEFCDLTDESVGLLRVRADIHRQQSDDSDVTTRSAQRDISVYNIERTDLSASMNNYMLFEASLASADETSKARGDSLNANVGSQKGLKLSHNSDP